MRLRGLVLLVTICGMMGCAHTPSEKPLTRGFDPRKDSFAFANETLWAYKNGEHVEPSEKQKKDTYSTHCFVMSRSAVQFWKFAQFAPELPRLDEEALAGKIREVTSEDAWRDPLPVEKRVVIPGYRNLYEMSRKHEQLLKDNIGLAWPTFFRLGNVPIVVRPSREHQSELDQELQKWISLGFPSIVWMYDFPKSKVNHVVVVYATEGKDDGKGRTYLAYDPNSPGRSLQLHYDPAARTFSSEKTFYYGGGEVSLRRIYVSPFQ